MKSFNDDKHQKEQQKPVVLDVQAANFN